MRIPAAIVLLLLAQGVAGCDGARPMVPSVLAPTPAPLPAPQVNMMTVTGNVFDSAFRALGGASVEVLDGPQAGLVRIADGEGRFVVAGKFDQTTRFRATSDGHDAATETLYPACSSCSTLNPYLSFYLPVPGQPVDIAGDYTLTFSADSACADIPSEFRRRTYEATIMPVVSSSGPVTSRFNVRLSGAPLLEYYDVLGLGVAGDLLVLEFRSTGSWVVEEVASNTYIGFDGRAEALLGASRVSTIAASFQGSVDYCALRSPMASDYDCNPRQAVAHANCESRNHQLLLTRR